MAFILVNPKWKRKHSKGEQNEKAINIRSFNPISTNIEFL